ncbi:MAG TPA: NAD-dependent epimerase/dehydratase family protein [Aggregatilinea sp.]|uniref:NAD-dependent epimerase/dehydratase family protein n=1 Tax=Aggregatilinea sp. TaxID=2806333 RepID=UPI002C31E317|nr:NAD-dependent epimerase/dehydratase family protein [Aggregatilinea sp.]HML22836.1 NAD-dependent epimerase/dehydratase family protein [Aggregatilinea sp.]
MQVLVSGITSGLGRLLAERLVAEPGVGGVMGLDDRPLYPVVPGVQFTRARADQSEWHTLLARADVVIAITSGVWPRGVAALAERSKRFLRAVYDAGVPRLITVGSSLVYGPYASVVTEQSPVRGHEGGPYGRALAFTSDYFDTLALNWPGGVLTRLRTAWICGPRHVRLVQHLAAGPVLACGYGNRRVQLLHEADAVEAILLAVRHPLPGVYNVAPDEGLPLREVAAALGHGSTCAPLAWIALRAGLRGVARPFEWARALVSGTVIAADRLRAVGWTPAYSTRRALDDTLALLPGRD